MCELSNRAPERASDLSTRRGDIFEILSVSADGGALSHTNCRYFTFHSNSLEISKQNTKSAISSSLLLAVAV